MREPFVEVVSVAPRPTAVVAQVTTWAEFPRLWSGMLDEVYAAVRPRPELEPPAAPGGEQWQNVMLYADDRPGVEVGVLVAGAFAAEGRVVPSELPAGDALRTVHRGGYAALGATHDAVHRHARDHGLTLAGPRWEIYGHPDPDDVEIEIFYLLA